MSVNPLNGTILRVLSGVPEVEQPEHRDSGAQLTEHPDDQAILNGHEGPQGQARQPWLEDLRTVLADDCADLQAALAELETRLARVGREPLDELPRALKPIVEGRSSPDEPRRDGSAPTIAPVTNARKAVNGARSPIRAHCDYPSQATPSIVKKRLNVSGWALSPAGIREVDLLVDGRPRGHVSYGAPRPEMKALHPDACDAGSCGFLGSASVVDLENGEHVLAIRITARDGEQTELSLKFRVDSGRKTEGTVPDLNAEYQEWLSRHAPRAADIDAAYAEAARFVYRPTISLIVPIYNTPKSLLEAMIASVQAQVYGKWELCLADDASTVEHVRPMLTDLADADPRIKVVSLAQNQGISGASNAALALATGDFIGLLDHDDVLSPLALFEVVRVLNEKPETDLIYSDEDKVDEKGRFHWDPFFKPDWSPDLLLSMNYICHFGVYRRSLVEEIGGFRSEFDGSQDYDLVLRFTERTDRIHHIPKILYSWRAIPGSGAQEVQAKPYALDTARMALAEALKRRGWSGRVDPGCAPGRWRVRYELREQPGVTVVIPSGGKLQYIAPCLESVLTRTTYPNFQVLVVDNSKGNEVVDLCSSLKSQHLNLCHRRIRLKPFNYPALNNRAVKWVKTPYIVLLNDDTTILTPDWIESMLEHAQRPEVGVVGAKLLFPNDHIQHAGVILGPYDNCGHAFKHYPDHDHFFPELPQVIRNCSAVTFACVMMRRSVYEEVGGLDEVNLRVAFNDVDFCLRVQDLGYQIVYTPHAMLYHHESVTKETIFMPGEVEYMQNCWEHVIRHDPYYNPNLTRDGEDYSLNLAESCSGVKDPGPVPSEGTNAAVASCDLLIEIPLRYKIADRANRVLKASLGPIHRPLKGGILRSWRKLKAMRRGRPSMV